MDVDGSHSGVVGLVQLLSVRVQVVLPEPDHQVTLPLS